MAGPMEGAGRALDAAVRAALGGPGGGALGRLLPFRALTALVGEAGEPRLADVLPPVLEALDRIGIGAGRRLLVVATAADGAAAGPELVRRIARAAPGLPCVVHRPGRSPCFRAGRAADGAVIELDDELREAEAILCLARVARDASAAEGPARLLLPGLASPETRRVIADPGARERAAETVAFDAALCWGEESGGARAAVGAPGGWRERLDRAAFVH